MGTRKLVVVGKVVGEVGSSGEGMIWCNGAGDDKGVIVWMAAKGEISGS